MRSTPGRWRKACPISLAPGGFFGARECTVQVGCGADQREMRKRLWKVPKVLSIGAEFLRIKTKMVGVSQELFKQQLRPFELACTGEAFDIPERAGGEVSLGAGKAVHIRTLWHITADQSVFD